MGSLQFVSPYMSKWYSCCPKCLIIHPTKPLIFCPCNHFLANWAEGFFTAHVKWGSVITRLGIQDSNCRKGQTWDEADPSCRVAGRKSPGKDRLADATSAGVRQCWGILCQQELLSHMPHVLLGATGDKAFQGFPNRTVTMPLLKFTAYFV